MAASTQYADDPTLLKVKGDNGHYFRTHDGESRAPESDEERDEARKQYIKKVSAAILTVVAKHKSARLKAVGAPSLSNALKASIIARGEGSKKGLDLVIEPSFDNADFDGSIKTAIVLRVVNRTKE